MLLNAPDPYAYEDYRAFLRDYYQHKKAKQRGFSFRLFSKKAGLGSPNHLKRVMEGERNLTPVLAKRFASALGLSGDQKEYFLVLVEFCQAKTSEERAAFYENMLGIRGYQQIHKLAKAEAEYHNHWYIAAIRELVLRKDFCEDPEWIAKTMVPPISKKEAKHAIDILIDLQFIVRNKKGRLIQAMPLVTTGNEVRRTNIIQYHREMMKRASESMDVFASEERDISSLTLGLTSRGLLDLKKRIQSFRKEILTLAATQVNVEQVIQLNFQLFPLSNKKESPE